MDEIVNALAKAGLRRDLVHALFDYFQIWKFERLQEMLKPHDERILAPFKPLSLHT